MSWLWAALSVVSKLLEAAKLWAVYRAGKRSEAGRHEKAASDRRAKNAKIEDETTRMSDEEIREDLRENKEMRE